MADRELSDRVAGILDDQQHGAVHVYHVAVHGLEAEAVLLRAVDEVPRVALRARREVEAQLSGIQHKDRVSIGG